MSLERLRADLDARQEQEDQPPPPGALPSAGLESLRAQLDQEAREKLAAAQLAAQPHSPDDFARAQRLGQPAGVPPLVAVDNLDELQQDDDRRRLNALSAEQPSTGSWLQNPSNMGVARDDVVELSLIGKALAFPLPTLISAMVRNPESAKHVAKSTYAGLRYDVPSQAMGLAAAAAETVGANTVPWAKRTPMAIGMSMRAKAEAFEKEGTEFAGDPNDYGFIARSMGQGARSLGAQVPGIIASMALGGPVPMLTLMGVQTLGGSYLEGRKAGLGVGRSLTYAGVDTLIEIGSELAPAVKLFKNMKVDSPLVKTIVDHIKGEQVGEIGALIGQKINAYVSLPENKDKTIFDFAKELPAEIAETIIATMFASSIQSGVMASAEKVLNRVNTSAEKAQLRELARLNDSNRGAEYLAGVMNAAAGSKLTERSPEHLEDFVRHSRDSGQNVPTSVYLDAEAVQTYFQEQGLDPVLEITALVGNRADAVEGMGSGDIVIPFERFLARTAKSKHAEALRGLARIDPEHLAPSELGSANVKAAIDKIVAEHKDEEVPPEQAAAFEEVRAAALADILGTNQYTAADAKTVAEKVASHYARRAARRGKGESPMQLYRGSLKGILVGAPIDPGATAMQQEGGPGPELQEPELQLAVPVGTPLSQIKVKRSAVETDTGRKLKVKQRADLALADVDGQIAAFKGLLACLSN